MDDNSHQARRRVESRRAGEARRNGVPSDRVVSALAETFRAMSDPTRVRIIAALTGQELSVGDLADVMDLTPSAISHQLRLLRGQRLVRYRREGRQAFYRLDDEHIEHLFAEGLRHVGNA